MKKIICIVLIVAILLFATTACSKSLGDAVASAVKSSVQEEADQTAQASQDAGEAPSSADANNASGNSAGNDAYTSYMDAKSKLVENISNVMSADESAGIMMMGLLGLSFIDISLAPLSVITSSEDPKAAAIAMEMLGMNGVKVTGDSSNSKMEYTDEEGKTTTFEAKYDKGSGSMTSTMSENGEFVLMSEFTKTSSGYAGQTYMKNDDGTFETIKIVTNPDGTKGRVGISSNQTSQPASIFQKGDGVGADFGKDAQDWYALENGKASASVGGQTYNSK